MLLHEKKLYASHADRMTFEMFKEAGVIVPHHSHKVSGKQICTHCADGFRPHYKEWIKALCFSSGGAKSFFHTFSGNGDPMRFALHSPLSRPGTDEWGDLKILELAETLRWADELNVNVEQMRDVHHWPCKAGLDRKITFSDSIDLVVRGKHRIKRQVPSLRVALELFIDWKDDEHTVNLIKKEMYVQFLKREPKFAKQYDSWLAYDERVKTLPVIYTRKMEHTALRA